MLVLAALLLGLFGSAHCVLMCGGIAGTVVQLGRGPRRPPAVLDYNAGRVLSYTVLGAVVGALGHAADFVPHAAQALRLCAGVLLALTGLYVAGVGQRLGWIERFGMPLWRAVRPLASRTRSALALGAIWGLMPCGLVYAAFGLAIASGSALSGALVMLAFGAGTLPAMVATGLASVKLAPALRSHAWVRRAAGVAVLSFGLVDIGVASAAMTSHGHPACACHGR